MQAIRRQFDHFRESGLLKQLVRFGIAGALSSVVYSLVYLPLTAFVFPAKMAVAAVPFAFALAVTFSYVVHSRWSFKDQATAAAGTARQAKFVAVQAAGLSLNAVITWVGTSLLYLHPWVPLVPAIFLAAIMSFALNRFWVFN